MGQFLDAAKIINSAVQLVKVVANTTRVLSDPNSTPEEKQDASQASVLAKKKIADQGQANASIKPKAKAKGGAVTKMYHGGMAHGKKHMYLGGDSSVKDNAGLRALKLKSPATYTKITGRNA